MAAAALTACCLVVVAPPLPAGQCTLLETVALGAVLALAAMLGAWCVDYARRLRVLGRRAVTADVDSVRE